MRIIIKKQIIPLIISCVLVVPFFIHAHNTLDKAIDTPHFSIRFHNKLSPVAQHLANTLEAIHWSVFSTLGFYHKPINCILNHKSVITRSYFNPLPKHIQIFSLYTPNPYLTSNTDCLTLTAIHEFQHAVQTLIQEKNLPFWLKPIYKVFNVYGLITPPAFFLEGHAVGIETAFTKSGRGRIPHWEMAYKVDLLERGINKFSKQVFGSYRYPIADYYRLGYYFTTFIQSQYGPKAINKIYQLSSVIPYMGFFYAVKSVTKKSVFQIYKNMSKSLLLMWQKQLENLKITPAISLIPKKNNDNIDYFYPFIDTSNNIFAWKSGIGTRHQLVQLIPNPSTNKNPNHYTNFKEKRLTFTLNYDSIPNQCFTIGQGCAVWLESYQVNYKATDEETGKNFMEYIRLQYYDFKTKKTTNLLKKCRYNAVSLSPSTKQLIVVESDINCKQNLVIVDTKSGTVIKKINSLNDGSYLTPNWVDEEHIVVIHVKNQKNCVLLINTNTEKVETLLPASYEHRNTPKIYKDYLLYNSSYNGIDNIYAMHLPTKSCFQITSRKYGAYLGVVDQKTNQLVFCDYTKNGMDIAVMPFEPALWTPLEQVEDKSLHYYRPLLPKSSDSIMSIPNHIYPIKNNHFIKKNINWKPAYVENYYSNNQNPSKRLILFELYNLQNNFLIKPHIIYKCQTIQKQKERKIRLGTNFKFYTACSTIEIQSQTTRSFLSALPWYGKYSFDLQIPYYFTLNSSFGSFTWQTKISLTPIKKKSNQIIGLQFQHQSLKSIRDIYPPWKQDFVYQLQRTSQNYNTSRLKNTVYLDLFFPGIGAHHAFNIKTSLNIVNNHKNITCIIPNELKNITQTLDQISYHHTYHKLTTYLGYVIPLLYPDLDLLNLGFLKTINMQSFLNLTWATKPKHYKTVYPNIDIGIQLHFITLLLPFSSFPINFTYILTFYYQKNENQYWQFKTMQTAELYIA